MLVGMVSGQSILICSHILVHVTGGKLTPPDIQVEQGQHSLFASRPHFWWQSKLSNLTTT